MYRIAAVPSPTSPAFRPRATRTRSRRAAGAVHPNPRSSSAHARPRSPRGASAACLNAAKRGGALPANGDLVSAPPSRAGADVGGVNCVVAFHVVSAALSMPSIFSSTSRAGPATPSQGMTGQSSGPVVDARRPRAALVARCPRPSRPPTRPARGRSRVHEHNGRSSPRRRHQRAIAQIPPPERSPPIEISSENGPTKSLEALPRTFMHVYGGPPPCLFSVPSLDQSDRNVPQRWWFGCLAKGHGHCPSAPGGGATCSCRRWTSLVLRPGARTWSSSSSETRIKATQRRFRRKSWLSFTIARRFAGRRLLHRGCIMGHLRRTRSADGGRATYTC